MNLLTIVDLLNRLLPDRFNVPQRIFESSKIITTPSEPLLLLNSHNSATG